MDDKETQTYKLTEDITSTSRRAEIESMISRSNTSHQATAEELDTTTTNLSKYLSQKEDQDYEHYPGIEASNYDFTSERLVMHKTNLIESVAHLVKGTLGAGVLTMHEAFMNGGLWISLGFTFFFGFLNYYSMYMLGNSAQVMYTRTRVSKLTYPDLAEAAAAKGSWQYFRKFSKIFRYTVDVTLILFMSGTCCIYQIIIAATFKEAIETASTAASQWFYGDLRMYILITSPILLLLCLIRKFRILAIFSMLSDAFVGVCVLATLYYSLQTGESISDRRVWTDFHGFVKFCGICIYCTCGIAVCLPVENNMRKPRLFPFIICWGMLVVVILNAITGFFGYWGWGETCKSPVTIHMPTNIFTNVLQFLLAIMLSVTFAVEFWVPFRIVWHYIRLLKRFRGRHTKTLHAWERLYRSLLAFLVTCVSLSFPNLIPFMVFVSFFFLGFIAFVFPAFIESLITWNEDQNNIIRWRSMKNVALIIFGFILSFSAFFFFYW